jgi:hypothetical protein
MPEKAKNLQTLKLARQSMKLVQIITESGHAGVTHSHLLLATRLKTRELADLLKPLEDDFTIVSRRLRTTEFGLGRQPRRYWLRDFAPKELLTAPAPGDTPTLEPGTAPPKGETCKQCGGAIPSRGPGRLPDYCSIACRNLAAEGGLTLGRFLDRAHDPRVFAQLAILLVAMDLIARGLHVAFDLLLAGANLIVHDGTTPAIVTVVPLSNAGYFPPDEAYERMAAVYRDGRIRYGGRDPLVLDPPAEGIKPEAEPSNPQETLAPEPETPEDE